MPNVTVFVVFFLDNAPFNLPIPDTFWFLAVFVTGPCSILWQQRRAIKVLISLVALLLCPRFWLHGWFALRALKVLLQWRWSSMKMSIDDITHSLVWNVIEYIIITGGIRVMLQCLYFNIFLEAIARRRFWNWSFKFARVFPLWKGKALTISNSSSKSPVCLSASVVSRNKTNYNDSPPSSFL